MSKFSLIYISVFLCILSNPAIAAEQQDVQTGIVWFDSQGDLQVSIGSLQFSIPRDWIPGSPGPTNITSSTKNTTEPEITVTEAKQEGMTVAEANAVLNHAAEYRATNTPEKENIVLTDNGFESGRNTQQILAQNNQILLDELDGLENTTRMGRLVVQMDTYVDGLNEPDGTIWISQDQEKHSIVLSQPVTEAGWSYKIWLLDWTTEELDPETNTTSEHTALATDSTTDILVDTVGDISITINGSQCMYIVKRTATDSAGHVYNLTWILDKENNKLKIGGLEQLEGATFPVTIS